MSGDTLSVRLLGSVAVFRASRELPLGGLRRSALVAMLALAAPRVVGRSDLVDGLWGEDPPSGAINTLQVHVSALRRTLGRDAILTASAGYRLSDEVDVDVPHFVAAGEVGRRQLESNDPRAALTTLAEALEWWRGPALAGIDDLPFASTQRTRLDELRFSCLTAKFEAELALGIHREAVADLQLLVDAHPLREDFRNLLMRALYRSDRQVEALEVFEAGRRLLRDELGVEVSPESKALHHRMLNQSEERTGYAAPVRPTHSLPGLLDRTVAREDEINDVMDLLTDPDNRLVSLVGPGGVGKTRVGIAAGTGLKEHFRDGVWFIPLAEAEKGSDVASIVSTTLSLPAGDETGATLFAALQHRRALLICDNFEHVLDAADLITKLLEHAPSIKILVTSRQRLMVRGERPYRVEPLGVADESDDSPAAALFMARAELLPGELTEDHRRLISEICIRCEGLPLAIELAAARARALTLTQLRDRLGEPLSLLEWNASNIPNRQASLRASINWSLSGLPPDSRDLLCRLSVFRGGFTLPAATAVSGSGDEDATLRHLEGLLDHSLIDRKPWPGRGYRFSLLEMVRQHCAELVESDTEKEVRRLHARYFRDEMEVGPEPHSIRVMTRWSEWTAEQANLRAAIRWALASDDAELAADILAAGIEQWESLFSRDEVADWLDQLWVGDDVSPGRRADVIYMRASLFELAGQTARAIKSLIEGLNLVLDTHDTRRQAWMNIALSWQHLQVGENEVAMALALQGERLARGHEDALMLQLQVFTGLGLCEMSLGEGDLGASKFEAAIELEQRLGWESPPLPEWNNLSEIAILTGDFQRAIALSERGMAAARGVHPLGLATLQGQRGLARLLMGTTGEAKADLEAALDAHVSHASVTFALDDVLRLAAAMSEAEPEASARLLGVFDEGTENEPFSTQEMIRTRYLTDLPERLGEATYAAVYASGRKLVEVEGVLGALTLINVALQDPSLGLRDNPG